MHALLIKYVQQHFLLLLVHVKHGTVDQPCQECPHLGGGVLEVHLLEDRPISELG